ncbi:MAG: hypothetical protein ACYSRZ_00705 [Planctomycetota bacterium]|jgi:hypothetical protein
MRTHKKIKKLIRNMPIQTNASVNDAVLDELLDEFNKSKNTYSAGEKPNAWRIIMNKNVTKFATAAVIIIALALLVNLVDKSATPAYGLEQTIQASHGVRYIHTKSFWPPHEEPMEAWIEFDTTGAGRNFRIQMPEWTDPWGHDGDKIIVWKDNKAQMWLKKKNMFGIFKDNEIADMVFKSTEQFDPKTALTGLQLLKSEGKVELDIDLPEDKASPIIVTATILEKVTEEKSMTNIEREMAKLFNMWKGSGNEISKLVLLVDQATKLVTSIEFYEQRQGQDHCAYILEYYDYNQPIAAEIFVLEDEIPADAMRMDQATQDVGIAQGQLTDKEIAAEMIRQFLEALIEQDYVKAGRLWGGVPAERMEKVYGQIRFIRILSIGQAVPCSEAGESDDHYCTGIHVPCVVEIEENGKVKPWKVRCVSVRQVHGQPDRWQIISGFRGV